MRKLGTWGGLALAAALSVVGLGSSAGPAPAQGTDVPWLGVMTQSLNRGLREGLDYDGKGVLISQVMRDSPAERAGIRKGDIIVSVNSRTVDSPSTLTDLIRGSRVGRSVSIVLVRDGQRRTVTPRLTERPNDFETPEQGDMNDFHYQMGPLNEWHDGEGGARTFVFPGMGRGRLGVRLSDLNEDLGSYFDVRDGQGALVLEVLKDTPADRAGLKAGDVLTKIGDRRVSGSDDVVEALQDAPEGKISITAVRKGASRTFEAELDEAPRALRIGPGRDLTVLRPRERLLTPEVRRKVERDARGNDQEIQELRDQLRELQRKLDQLENDRD